MSLRLIVMFSQKMRLLYVDLPEEQSNLARTSSPCLHTRNEKMYNVMLVLLLCFFCQVCHPVPRRHAWKPHGEDVVVVVVPTTDKQAGSHLAGRL